MDAAIAPKMHHSFAGMDAPGDTQPDSQMHREWTSGIFGTAETTTRMPSPRSGLKSLFTEHDDEDDAEPLTDGVEVIASSQVAQDAAITSPTALEDDREQSLRTEYAFTSPLKFATPAVADRMRNGSGQMLSSTAGVETTPDTVASASAFGGAFGRSGIGQPLSLTQAFDLTQARTSPVIAGTEDPIFQRPSPNFNHARHSSPIPALSSPIKVMRNERSDPVMRSSSEPRSEYVTMKESQERRKLTKGASRAPLVQEDSWEELSAAQKRLQRQRQREQSHREAGVSLSSITAPALETAHGVREHRGDAQHASKARQETTLHMWHDGVQEEEDDDIAMKDASQHLVTEGDEVDRSPEELSQGAAVAFQPRMRYNGLENGIQVLKTSSHPQHTQPEHRPGHGSQQGTPSSQLQRESQIQAPASQSILRTAPHSSRGSVAVMDSQPDVTAGRESWPRPDTRFPSSPSINQYSINQTTVASRTGYTSQMISSSMIQLPPGTSPDGEEDIEEEEVPEEEERVPSSPPMLTDELTYDEHGYEEHPGEDDEHEIHDMGTGGADARLEEEDDLPIAEPEQAADDEEPAARLDNSDVQADAELESLQPMKVDNETDQEIPETLEEDKQYHTAQEDMAEPLKDTEAEQPPESAMPAPSLQRQTTIPDTDALDETQPSWFTEEAHPPQDNSSPSQAHGEKKTHEVTNGTEPFSTAQEQPTASQSNVPVPTSSKDEGSDSIHDVSRIRSLNDIANLPNTQRSAAEDEIDIPCLSGFDDANGDTHMSSPVPAAPASKRRKTALATKSSVFRSPVRQAAAEKQAQKVPPSPLKDIQRMREETPPTASTQEREERGALAASEARENVTVGRPATLKSKGASRPARPQNSKRGSLKSARAVIATMSSPINSPSKPKTSVTTQKPAPATPTRNVAKSVNNPVDVEMRDAGDSTDELASSPPPSASCLPVRLTPRKAEVHTGEVVVPNRVFASWPGSHYYPATCTGRSDSKQLQVRFDDGNTTSLDFFQVRSLDLRAGDQVKVDVAGMKKHTYVVVGLTEKCNDLENYDFPMTDRYGHVCVVLEEKQRDSLPPGKAVPPPKQVTVQIANVYLTTQLWGRLRNRTFQLSPPPSPSKPASQLGTPVPTEALTTPSFTRRGVAAPSLLKDATNRAGSVASSSRSGSGIFSNMSFVLTSTGDGMDKDAVARTIKANGGRVLEQGFHELFDTESIELSASQSRRTSVSATEEGGALTLKDEFKKLGFVALITDSHSRSTKYLQALALNVPCLHLRWVNDSLSATHALSFARYLLPAGLSKYLDPNGIVRSRAMRIYDPSHDSVSFEKTLSDRDLLLQNQSVLLVTGKSKKEIEKRQPFVFLTHALGASNVGRCADVSSATQLLANGQWDWVYVDSDHSSVADAAAELFGSAAPAKSAKGSFKKGKKRKREDGEAEELVVKGEVAGRRVRVASAEFVIQSLILGALVDE